MSDKSLMETDCKHCGVDNSLFQNVEDKRPESLDGKSESASNEIVHCGAATSSAKCFYRSYDINYGASTSSDKCFYRSYDINYGASTSSDERFFSLYKTQEWLRDAGLVPEFGQKEFQTAKIAGGCRSETAHSAVNKTLDSKLDPRSDPRLVEKNITLPPDELIETDVGEQREENTPTKQVENITGNTVVDKFDTKVCNTKVEELADIDASEEGLPHQERPKTPEPFQTGVKNQQNEECLLTTHIGGDTEDKRELHIAAMDKFLDAKKNPETGICCIKEPVAEDAMKLPPDVDNCKGVLKSVKMKKRSLKSNIQQGEYTSERPRRSERFKHRCSSQTKTK